MREFAFLGRGGSFSRGLICRGRAKYSKLFQLGLVALDVGLSKSLDVDVEGLIYVGGRENG